jgi:hypothetical protein
MDYDKKHHLFAKQGDSQTKIQKKIIVFAKPLKGNLYVQTEPEAITFIKASYDATLKRTLIKTETTPNIEPSKELTDLLIENRFEKLC